MISRKKLVLENLVVNFLKTDNSGVPLVFLHGWRSESAVWFKIMAEAEKKGFRSFALDLPGFGLSEIPPEDFDLKKYAAIVKSFLEKENLGKVYLIGHSFGGRIALKFTSLFPDNLLGLILVDSAGLKPKDKKITRFFAKFFKPFFKIPFLRPFHSLIYKIIGAEDYIATPRLKNIFLNIVKENLESSLSEIKTKTLLVWGEEDKTTPLSFAETFHRRINDSNLEIIKGAGHFSFVDKPEEFSKILFDFVK